MLYYKRMPIEKFDITVSFAAMEEMGFFVDREIAPFNNQATDFDIINAWWMIDHSRLAYIKEQDFIREVLKDAGYDDVKFIWDDDSGTKVYVTWNEEHIVVSFTGTELDNGPEDILTDLDFFPTESKQGGVVHKGFLKAFEAVWKRLDALVKSLGDKPIWVTGHSLGAALSVHYSSRVKANGCYNFGCPRVGSRKFVKTILTPIYRVAKDNDIVTRIPTPPIYRHAGNVYFITDNGKILKNPHSLRMFKERLGGSELRILWQLFKMFVLKSPLDFILGYLHGHSSYNYSVFMWNNIDKNIKKR